MKDMWQQEVNRIEAHQASHQEGLIKAVQLHVDWLYEQIKQMERDIGDHIDRYPELKRDADQLRSVPGIGGTIVAKVVAYAGDVRRFANALALAAFVGVTTRHRLSGTSVKGRTLLSRTGHAALRKALYMPGMVSLRYNAPIKALAQRLREKGMAPKAIVEAAMRKLTHLLYVVITSGKLFNADLAGMAVDIKDGISCTGILAFSDAVKNARY